MGPFYSDVASVTLALQEGSLQLSFTPNARALEIQLGKAPPRLTFLGGWLATGIGWRESAEILMVGAVVKVWSCLPREGAAPEYFLLMHLGQRTVEVRFGRIGEGMAGTLFEHPGLIPLRRASLSR